LSGFGINLENINRLVAKINMDILYQEEQSKEIDGSGNRLFGLQQDVNHIQMAMLNYEFKY